MEITWVQWIDCSMKTPGSGRSGPWLASIPGYNYTMKTKNDPCNSMKKGRIQKLFQEYSTCVNLPKAGCPQKLSARTRKKLVREATKTLMTTLKELKASVAVTGETAYNNFFLGTSLVKALRETSEVVNSFYRHCTYRFVYVIFIISTFL